MIYQVTLTSYEDEFVQLFSNDECYDSQKLRNTVQSAIETTIKNRGHLDFEYFNNEMKESYGFKLADIVSTEINISQV